MQIESKIKEILSSSIGVERKAEEILKFMRWDKKKLTNAIIKHGTSSGKQQSLIIKEFWGRPKA